MINRLSNSNLLSGAVAALAIVMCQGGAVASPATSLLGASGFNLFTLSDFTASGSDTIGTMAVGGNFISSGWTPASGNNGSGFTLQVGGNFTDQNFTLGSGSVYVGGNASITNASLSGDLRVVGSAKVVNGSVAGNIYSGSVDPGTSSYFASKEKPFALPSGFTPVDFSSALTQLPAFSQQLSTSTSSGGTVAKSANGSNGITITASGCTLCVITLTGTELQAAMANGQSGVTINAPSNATVLINVNSTSTGSAINISGPQITINGTTKNEVLWNFYNAGTINYASTSWQGSILAPGANFVGINSYSSGNIEGQLIVKSDSATVEIHNFLFDGFLPAYASTATPEPSSWALGIGGLALVVLASRKNATAKR